MFQKILSILVEDASMVSSVKHDGEIVETFANLDQCHSIGFTDQDLKQINPQYCTLVMSIKNEQKSDSHLGAVS